MNQFSKAGIGYHAPTKIGASNIFRRWQKLTQNPLNQQVFPRKQ
jgi:hypothetical protein